MRSRSIADLLFVVATVGAIVGVAVASPPPRAPWTWNLPTGFPAPIVPGDNPMSAEKVALGRRLFYDARLSGNQTQSCGSCHQQSRAFTDGRSHAIGSTGETHRRSSMSLTNVAYASRLTWASPLVVRLEDQAILPMFGDAPVELGMPDDETLVTRLSADEADRRRFAAAFPDDANPVTLANATRAIAAFERTLISGDAPYDRYLRGEVSALSPLATRGMELFFSERLECFHCHGGFNFSDSVTHTRAPDPERAFHNNGLYDVDGNGSYPHADRGLFELTHDARDMGRFRAPTLRNIAVTGPYMHDGSIATLTEVIAHYARGGRRIDGGENRGDGSASPRKDPFIVGFILDDEETRAVVAFLESLTDETFLHDRTLSDPFVAH